MLEFFVGIAVLAAILVGLFCIIMLFLWGVESGFFEAVFFLFFVCGVVYGGWYMACSIGSHVLHGH